MEALYGFINMERQKKQQNEEAIGKSRGGLSTKIHAAVDAFVIRFVYCSLPDKLPNILKLKH